MFRNEDWIELRELMSILGFTDERSIRKWCNAHIIPVIIMGLKKYILSRYITQYIDNQIVIFENRDQEKITKKESYKPKNKIIADYLAKYESSKNDNAAKKG